MANNDVILIDGIIDEKLKSLNIDNNSDNRGRIFETFAIGEILKSYDLSEKELENGLVDGSDDGGIDGFYIFINGILIIDPIDHVWPKSGAELEIYIITCKHHDTYELSPMESLDSSLSEIFDLRLSTSNFKSKLNREILEKRENLIYAYRKIASAISKCTINVIYASRGDSLQVAQNIVAKGNKIESVCRELFLESLANVTYWGSSDFIKQYRKKRNAPTILNTVKCFQCKSDFVALVSLNDYYCFVTDDYQKLKRYYFEENVRDYLGANRTNLDIANTLVNQNSPDFWLLNNGITILSSRAVLYDGQIEVENVQIVNGLQTTNTIYQYFSNNQKDSTGRCLLVKIICSSEENVRNQIVQATNNQSAISLYSLHATDKIQKDIEAILLQYDLFYERKVKYYKNLGYEKEKIFSPLYLAGGYIALVLKLPHRAATLKSKFMNNPTQYKKVFSDKSDLRIWPQIAFILRRVDTVAEANRANLKTSSEKYLKTVRPLLAIIVIARIIGKFSFSERDLLKLDLQLLTNEIISLVVNDVVTLINNDPMIRYSKDISTRNKMSEMMEIIGNRYGFSDYPSIRRRKDFILDDYEITEDFLELLEKELPSQPWPAGIHRIIAEKFGCKPSKVYRSIDMLIEKGVFKNQVDGILL